ncbi:MAG TPA: DUF2934 domain-containing protein [Gemmatimonadaceae bacterium]|jgi:hypothetical protein
MSPAKPRKTAPTRAADDSADREVPLSGGDDRIAAGADDSSADGSTDDDSRADRVTAPGDGASHESNGDAIDDRIRKRAYELFASRNSDDGNELDDWLAAEREVRHGHTSTEGTAPALLEHLSDNQEQTVAG